MDRVVSLAPSETATLRALGAGDRLVGATTHCDAPGVPAVGGWLTPDLDAVADLDPDLVLTADPLQADLGARARERGLAVHHREPATLEDVLAGFLDVGEAVGRPDAGRALADRARERLDSLGPGTPPDERPVVYCEEWGDPPMAAGNWVPDLVAAAGGRYPFVAPGERSRAVSHEAVAAADPAVVVVHHCGRGTAADPDFTAREWEIDPPVVVVDDALLNQPSPALLEGCGVLADAVGAVADAP